MMLSVGNDLIEIARVKRSIQNPRFIARVFGVREIEELKEKSAQSYAAAFAAKESFAKALGTGIRGFSMCEVELLHDEFGAPYLFLSGRARQLAEKRRMSFAVSVTHTDTLAGAVVIGTKTEETSR